MSWTDPEIDREPDDHERSTTLTGRTSERVPRFCASIGGRRAPTGRCVAPGGAGPRAGRRAVRAGGRRAVRPDGRREVRADGPARRPRRRAARRPRRRAARRPRRHERDGVRADGALRAGRWSRLGNEGGKPGGLRAPMRARLAQPPRISPGKRGRSGAVGESPRFVAGNREESGAVRPIAPQGIAKDARSAAQRTRKRTASLLALLPHCPIATSAPRGERSPSARTPSRSWRRGRRAARRRGRRAARRRAPRAPRAPRPLAAARTHPPAAPRPLPSEPCLESAICSPTSSACAA